MNFNGKTRLDTIGHPHSEKMSVRETWTLMNATEVYYTIEITDHRGADTRVKVASRAGLTVEESWILTAVEQQPLAQFEKSRMFPRHPPPIPMD